LNATWYQAAIRAGYSEKTSEVIGCENLRKLQVQITEARNERSARTEVVADRVIQELARTGVCDVGR
jgi:phage terminase small subunit